LCRKRTSGKHSAENGGFSCCACELAAGFETSRLHSSRKDGAICLKSEAPARTDLCLHSKRRGLSATPALLGNPPRPHRFLWRSRQGDCSSREVFAQEQVGCARRPYGDYQ